MRRLYRSKRDRIIGGVAGGLADYLEVDPTLIRFIWVLAALAGFGVLAYIVAWLIIPEAPPGFEHGTPPYHGGQPEEPQASPEGQPPPISGSPEANGGPVFPRARRDRTARLFGIALVVLGAWMLAERILPHFIVNQLWPLVLVVLGLYLLVSASRR